MRSGTGWAIASAAGVALFLVSFLLWPYDGVVGARVVGAPLLVAPAHALAFLGSELVVGPVLTVATAVLLWQRRWWGAARLAFGTLLPDATTRALKALVARPRPIYAIVEADGFAFPSGHATFGAAVAVLGIWFASRWLRGRWALVALLTAAATWAGAMAVSRMVLGVHSMSDVLAGIGVGVAVSSAVLAATLAAERMAARGAKPDGSEGSRRT